ncbi:MAG: presqualene diphosphate synthase HpnD [Methylobacteriaceae bacterium]|nr:presqualene diphosphate synthase HpnD [Methylobacteriaceae bacterium]MBV9244825.1 presqualene diphosphate synthase HpnD [Methylobacteriaceae bacterium]
MPSGEASGAAQQISSKSSFHAAMRILPPPRRRAMFEIYAFCRAVDDIADTPGPRGPRLEALAGWRDRIDALYAGCPPAGLAELAQVVATFGLDRENFLAVVDGMEMDVVEDIRAPDLAKLDLYCDRVASAVGRLSVRVFGLADPLGRELAHHLGSALQLTNILRDLDEDAGVGRLYLPAEDLAGAGIAATEPAEVLAHPALGRACAPLVARARQHFAAAKTTMDASPRAAVRAPRLMAAAYRSLLDQMEARGFAPPRQRPRVDRKRLLLAYLRHAAF